MINPDVINPPLGPQEVNRAQRIEKFCISCAHEASRVDSEPCKTCEFTSANFQVGEKPSGWVARIGFPTITGHLEKVKPLTAPDILSAAEKHMRDRAATYDKPEGERSMAQTVAVFNTFHGTSLTEAQGWHFMQILKDVRLFTRDGYHADSAEDGVAYAGLKAEAKAKE